MPVDSVKNMGNRLFYQLPSELEAQVACPVCDFPYWEDEGGCGNYCREHDKPVHLEAISKREGLWACPDCKAHFSWEFEGLRRMIVTESDYDYHNVSLEKVWSASPAENSPEQSPPSTEQRTVRETA